MNLITLAMIPLNNNSAFKAVVKNRSTKKTNNNPLVYINVLSAAKVIKKRIEEGNDNTTSNKEKVGEQLKYIRLTHLMFLPEI